jgi:hypothetical protein
MPPRPTQIACDASPMRCDVHHASKLERLSYDYKKARLDYKSPETLAFEAILSLKTEE